MLRRSMVLVLCVGFSFLLTAEGALAFGHRRATCRPTTCAPATCTPATCAPATCAPATCAPATCAPATCRPKVRYVEKMVLCPTYVTEHRKIQTVECRPEIRECKVTEYRQVCETRMVERTSTVMVPEQRTKTVECIVNVPVWKDVTKEYTVMVPHCEKRRGTRKVCRMAPVTQKRTVVEDQGQWEERPCPAPKTCVPATCAPKTCAPATCAPKTRKVWVPKCVEKEVEVTCMKPTWVEEPCESTVTVCRPETRTCTVRVRECKQEVRTQEVCYTVCVPKQVTRKCPETTFKCVPFQRVVRTTVMVPHQVEKVVPVCRVKMVPKTIKVPVCCPPAPCRKRCGSGC